MTVKAFNKAIGNGVVGCGMKVFGSEQSSEFSPES